MTTAAFAVQETMLPHTNMGTGTMCAAVFHGVNDIRVEDVEMVHRGSLDLRPLLTHRFKLAGINEAYKLFGERRDGVMKVVVTP